MDNEVQTQCNENIRKRKLPSITTSVYFIIILFFFQNCTAWPGFTAVLGLLGGKKGNSPLLLLPPNRNSGQTTDNSSQDNSEPDTINQSPSTTLSPPELGPYTNPNTTITQYQAIQPITPAYVNGNPTQCNVTPPLPTGLQIDPNTCVISGTPSVEANSTTYTVTPVNQAGAGNSQTITFEVYPALVNLIYTGSPYSLPKNQTVNPPITPVLAPGSGAIASCNISPSLPAGLSFNTTNCVISGTPTSITSQQTYTITAYNSQNQSTTVTISLEVTPPNPPANLNYPNFPSSFTVGVAIPSPIIPYVDGYMTNCVASPALPSGMVLDPYSCSISGTPNVTASSTTYMIVPSNEGGNGAAAYITFEVLPYPAVVSVTSPIADGAYKASQVIPIHVVFNRDVFVTGGVPSLALDTGNPPTTHVAYTSGSGTSTLVFTYTVAPGNTSSDLSYINSSSLNLNGAYIRDSHNNDANLTLPIPNQPNSLSANKNIVIDTTPPVISGVSPVSNSYINNLSLSYTLSETCATGSTTWTWVGGAADSNSPHVAAWVGTELIQGTKTNITLTNNPTLVDNAIYDISFNCTDPAGNVATTVTSTNVSYMASPPTVVMAETLDTDNNGKIDTYKVTFNKAINDSTFPGYVANSLGNITTHWLVAGYSGVRLIHGSAVTFATDTPNDAVIYIRFNETPLECSENTQVGCDTHAKPDLTTTSTPGVQDFATNPLAQITTTTIVEIDGANPVVVGARSLGQNLVDVYFSEPVDLTTSQTIANYTITPGITVTGATRDTINHNVVHLTTSNQTGGDTYTLVVSTNVKDLANLNTNSNANTVTFIGLVKPVVSSIVTLSATTLRITFNEVIVASTAECNTMSTCAAIYSNISLPVLSAVSELGAGQNSATFILTVNPMIEGQLYTTTVLQDTVQSYATSQKIGNTNNSATFIGDGKPQATISADTATACPNAVTTYGVARRVVIQYDQSVLNDGGPFAANNPSNYSITGCITNDCTSGHPPANSSAGAVTYMGANKFAVDFPTSFDTDNSLYQLTIQNVRDLTGNTIPLPGTLSFQCGTDTTPPSLISVSVVSATNTSTVLMLTFSEAVDNVTANNSNHYKYNTNPYGFGVNSAARQTNLSQVQLIFTPGLPNGGHQLRVQNVQDLAGNTILDNGVNNVQPFIVNAPTGFSGGSVFNDPFGDGTPSSNIVIYDGKIYIGADKNSSKLFETNFAMTTAQTITLDADGDLFNAVTSSFQGYLTRFTGCSTMFSNPPTPSQSCTPKRAVEGVDTIFAACVGGTSEPKFTGTQCTNAGGVEYMFIGALRPVVNQAYTRSFFYTTTKSNQSTIFPFQEGFTGDNGGAVAFRSMNMIVFKDYLFTNVGAEGGGGGRGGRVCMNPNGCLTGQSFLQNVNLDGWSRIMRIGVSSQNSLRNGSYNGAGAPYADPNEGNLVLNAVSTMYEHDNDGPGGNESQLYIANGGFYANPLPTAPPWPRTGTSDGGIVRTTLAYSTKNNLPGNCPNDTSGCSNFWEDVTPDTQEKWSRYLSTPWPQNSAATGASNCATSNIEMDCVEPYNTFVPALKAIPYMRTAPNGDLYVIRNACATQNICKNGDPICDFRTEKQVCPKGQEVPQIWRMAKNCGTATNCRNTGWALVAENGTTGKSNMGNANNSHITLLETVGNYLYIGYDNPVNGANVWRINMSSLPSGYVPSQSEFTQVSINGIGPDSGGANQKLFSHTTYSFDGKNWLIITTRDGVGAVRIYRTSDQDN